MNASRMIAAAALLLAGFIGGAAFMYLAPVNHWPADTPTRHAAQAPTQPGRVDIGFCQDMSVHHQQAVLMTSMALSRAQPAVKALAAAILAAQAEEMGLMRGWLALWHQPQSNPAPMAWLATTGDSAATQHMAPDSEHHDARPADTHRMMMGMASASEMNALWQRTGKPFDILFLQLMLRHHQGGVMMAKQAAQNAKLVFVRSAARRMLIEQQKEGALMQSMLQAYGVQPLPFP